MGVAEDLDDVAGALYQLPPAAFTAARNERASAESGDLASRIRALRKPTVTAWAVNLLVHDGQLAQAVDLSRALHDAQDDLDAVELAELGRQRRALAAGLARRAAELAGRAGATLSAAGVEDVEKAVNAAIMNEAVATAVLTGRLVRLPVDPSDPGVTVAGSVPGIPDRPPPARDDVAARRARKAAETAAREAAGLASEAARHLAKVTAGRDRARERLDHLRERIDDLQSELARLTSDAERLDAEAKALEEEHATASADARHARSAAEEAARALGDGT